MRRSALRPRRMKPPRRCCLGVKKDTKGHAVCFLVLLDCSSFDSAVGSLAPLLGMSTSRLLQLLSKLDVDALDAEGRPEGRVLAALGVDTRHPPLPSSVIWFHATRALPGTTFDEGLLPTLQAMPKLWAALGEAASQWLSASDWDEYQRSFLRGDRTFSGQFARKSMAGGWEGPFGFLVRDAALHPVDAQKDFTRFCETIEDICADFEEETGHDLEHAYQELSRPCLVVFRQPGAEPYTVCAAVNYAYYGLRGLPCGTACNTNFNGGGKPVPRELIERVEWL